MLFSKKTPEEKMEKLVHRKAWGELSEYMFKDKEHKIALAQALGTSETEEAIDFSENNDRLITAPFIILVIIFIFISFFI